MNRRLCVVALLTLMVSACHASDDTASPEGSLLDGGDHFQATVGRGTCESDPSIVCCVGTVTNTLRPISLTTQSFWITVEFLDADGLDLGEGGVGVTHLEFQETAVWEVGRRDGGEFSRCEVRSVTAYDW
jgi:hypothetical protein